MQFPITAGTNGQPAVTTTGICVVDLYLKALAA